MTSISTDGSEKVIQMDQRRKVSLRFKAVRVIEHIVESLYGEGQLVLMQKMGYSIEPEDIIKAKRDTMASMVKRHLDGKTTKDISGVISQLKIMAKEARFQNAALTAQVPEGLK